MKSWTSKQRFSHHGKYWNFEDIIVEPPTAQKPHPPMWMGAGSADSIRQVAERGYNLLLDQFASFERSPNASRSSRPRWKNAAASTIRMDVGVARAYYVAKDEADKQAALERRLEAQRRLEASRTRPTAPRARPASWPISDTREASEESALYGTPDEIARKTREAARTRRRICSAQRRWRPGPRQPAPFRARTDAGVRRRPQDARCRIEARRR